MIFFVANANAHMCEQMCTNARVDVSGQLVGVGPMHAWMSADSL